MRPLTALIFWVVMGDANAQSVKRVIDKNEDNTIQETYFVLTSDNAVKHGLYTMTKYHKLSVEGKYDHNLKEGEWKEYDFSGKKVLKTTTYLHDTLHGPYLELFYGGAEKLKGNYVHGKKDGPWVFHDWTGKLFESGTYNMGKESGLWNFYNGGKLYQQYDFNRKTFLINDDTSSNKDFLVQDAQGVVSDTLDTGPYYLGGMKHLYTFIGTMIDYPETAREDGVEGTVYAEVIVDADGSVANVSVSRGIGSGCDNETVRVLSLTNGRWIPATDKGKPVPTTIIIPVKFTLQ